MTIKQWPFSERPREKLLKRGPQSLSDAELLAIFIQSGIKGKTALDLAREAINAFGSLRLLLNANQKRFCSFPGLGQTRFVLLQAALEINKRYLSEKLIREDVLQNSIMTQHFISARLRDCPNEVFACLFLDNQNRMICFEHLFEGTINAATVHAREIVRRALQHNAAAIIFAHNHPSGNPEPSHADRILTQKLKTTFETLDIKVFDHIIVGDSCTVSFAEKNWL